MTKHLLKPTYDNFVNSVAKNRGLSREQILPFAEGKIYIANAPEIQGILIDEISSLYRVKAKMRKELRDDQIEFVKVKTENKYPFLPEIKVDLNLKEVLDSFNLQ